MTGRTPAPTPRVPTTSQTIARARRWLVLHRRLVSGAFAFLATLMALQVISGGDAESPRHGAADGASVVAADQLQYPIRLSDEAVAGLLAPGDVVDVLGSDPRGPAAIVAHDLLVTDVPTGEGGVGSAFGSDGDGLVVVAVTPDDALALAAAASRGPLTVAVHP
jgi:hypothetical protein